MNRKVDVNGARIEIKPVTCTLRDMFHVFFFFNKVKIILRYVIYRPGIKNCYIVCGRHVF